METTKPESVAYKQCSKCKETKELDHFYTSGITCRDCKNTQRREKYNNDDEHRKKLIQFASKGSCRNRRRRSNPKPLKLGFAKWWKKARISPRSFLALTQASKQRSNVLKLNKEI